MEYSDRKCAGVLSSMTISVVDEFMQRRIVKDSYGPNLAVKALVFENVGGRGAGIQSQGEGQICKRRTRWWGEPEKSQTRKLAQTGIGLEAHLQMFWEMRRAHVSILETPTIP